MDENQAFWTWYGEFLDEDLESARKVARAYPSYLGDAVVLPAEDPLMVEWNLWRDLYA